MRAKVAHDVAVPPRVRVVIRATRIALRLRRGFIPSQYMFSTNCSKGATVPVPIEGAIPARLGIQKCYPFGYLLNFYRPLDVRKVDWAMKAPLDFHTCARVKTF